ncbi:Chromo (CHRromatin Organization MOdifier) domain [Phytophthora infestans]|uniref:Chromo (CHRromatin Organization MOdifier) domain n=1 Tax=Phytophthora infestans TaxID=4787 RepID=A0A8S9UIL5_PHYIN|nr:Chromo (CHRromatin Organization MOdifier) domain [Phytophthora infestans]
MTGIPAMNPAEPIVTPIGVEPATIEDIKEIRGVNFKKSKEALEKMHKNVAEARNLARKNGRKKAAKRGCGPARVVDTSSNWIFVVENLLTGERREAHATHNSEGHVVEELKEARYNSTAKTHDLLVKWRGLTEEENSWEPVQNLIEDVPVFVKQFLTNNQDIPAIVKLMEDLNWSTM